MTERSTPACSNSIAAECLLCRDRHRRHTFATTLLRAGVSLPAVKELLGHRVIEMTLRYVQVSQVDLQREYHQAMQKIKDSHILPSPPTGPSSTGLAGLREALQELLHRMEMFRYRLDGRQQKTLRCLADRPRKIREELKNLDSPPE
ncbi:MAG: tyrosine-type recombinase/integrase [Acidobacteria bacterium]|nr:tyrosine-type recombinase/integrase [Acidobacteriota bacterium]